MLHLILTILKFIGIVLAAILGIIVLLLCIVLLVPMRYKVVGECDGTIKGVSAKANVSWLCHLVSGYVIYKDENLSWQMRILWKKLNVEKNIKKKSVAKKSAGKTKTESMKHETVEKCEKVHSEKANASKVSEIKVKTESQSKADMQDALKKGKRNIFEKIKYTFQTICDKIKLLLEKKEKLEEFVADTVHRSAFSRIWQEIVRLGRFLRPKKVQMNVHFGFDDPYNTGRVLASLSMLYPFYGEHINVKPDFEKQILEGDLFIKGHIHGIYAAVLMWNLFFDKNIRTAYKHIKAFQF